MGIYGNGYIIETKYSYHIDSDILLEFSLKESLSNVIRKIKSSIYKLLTKWENALQRKGTPTGIKSVLLKFVQKLKGLFKKTDDIKSIDDANKISKEFQDIKDQKKAEERKESEKMVAQDLASKKYSLLLIKIIDGVYFLNDSTEDSDLIGIAKQQGFDIFKYAEDYRKEHDVEVNKLEYKENKSIDDINMDFVTMKQPNFSGFTRENYQILKKEYLEYKKSEKAEEDKK